MSKDSGSGTIRHLINPTQENMEQKKVSPNRAKKEKIVAKLKEKIRKAKGLVFTNYQGLTHVQLEGLKNKIKSANAELAVTKNTLLKLSLLNTKHETRNTKQDENSSDFQGPTATLFLYGDPVGPLKEIARAIKELSLPTIKFGILEGQVVSVAELLKISTLASRETLLAQLVFGLKSPISGLHRALSWNLQKLVMTLKAIEKTKGVN